MTKKQKEKKKAASTAKIETKWKTPHRSLAYQNETESLPAVNPLLVSRQRTSRTELQSWQKQNLPWQRRPTIKGTASLYIDRKGREEVNDSHGHGDNNKTGQKESNGRIENYRRQGQN